MKKIILLITLCMCLISCIQRKYRLTYRVYYPGVIVTKTLIDEGYNNPHVESFRGTYTLHGASGKRIISTTAPVEIVKVEELDKE